MTLGTMFCLFAGLLAISNIIGFLGILSLFNINIFKFDYHKRTFIIGFTCTILGNIGFWGSLITGILWLIIHFGVVDTHTDVAPQTAADTIAH
jgi:hypothetical protein